MKKFRFLLPVVLIAVFAFGAVGLAACDFESSGESQAERREKVVNALNAYNSATAYHRTSTDTTTTIYKEEWISGQKTNTTSHVTELIDAKGERTSAGLKLYAETKAGTGSSISSSTSAANSAAVAKSHFIDGVLYDNGKEFMSVFSEIEENFLAGSVNPATDIKPNTTITKLGDKYLFNYEWEDLIRLKDSAAIQYLMSFDPNAKLQMTMRAEVTIDENGFITQIVDNVEFVLDIDVEYLGYVVADLYLKVTSKQTITNNKVDSVTLPAPSGFISYYDVQFDNYIAMLEAFEAGKYNYKQGSVTAEVIAKDAMRANAGYDLDIKIVYKGVTAYLGDGDEGWFSTAHTTDEAELWIYSLFNDACFIMFDAEDDLETLYDKNKDQFVLTNKMGSDYGRVTVMRDGSIKFEQGTFSGTAFTVQAECLFTPYVTFTGPYDLDAKDRETAFPTYWLVAVDYLLI